MGQAAVCPGAEDGGSLPHAWGQYKSGHMASDQSPIDAICEVTGGWSYAVTSARVLHQCIESLVQKLQSGVVIHFEKIGSNPPLLPGQKTAKLLLAGLNQGQH